MRRSEFVQRATLALLPQAIRVEEEACNVHDRGFDMSRCFGYAADMADDLADLIQTNDFGFDPEESLEKVEGFLPKILDALHNLGRREAPFFFKQSIDELDDMGFRKRELIPLSLVPKGSHASKKTPPAPSSVLASDIALGELLDALDAAMQRGPWAGFKPGDSATVDRVMEARRKLDR